MFVSITLTQYRNITPGNGGGGSNALIPETQQVDTFNLLPAAGSSTGQVWYVRNQSGTWLGDLFGTRKQSGFYRSDGVSWSLANDPLQYFVEGQISFKDSDGTGSLIYNLPLTAERTATWQDKDGTVAYLEDILPKLEAFTQDSTETSTFSTTGIVYLNLFKSGLDNSATYKVRCFYIWSHDATNTDFFMEVRNFAVLLPPQRHQQEPKDSSGGGGGGTDQRHYTSFEWEVTPTAGQIAIDLNFGTTDASDLSTVYGASIQLEKITQ